MEIDLVEASRVDDSDVPVPKRVSARRVAQEQRARQDRWRQTHIAPLEDLIEWGVPAHALALYGRWWQLERWLRDLIQLELQSRYHADWKSKVHHVEDKRVKQAGKIAYMASADDANPLGFADFGDLGTLIEGDWDLFNYALPPQASWVGTLNTLTTVRRRIAHCRFPHNDDLSRVEQTLRDLEAGAVKCLKSYSSVEWVTADSDPDVASLLGDRGGHNTHALQSYNTRFHLHKSHRPWSATERSGLLYHARWNCGRPPDIKHVWEYLQGVGNLDLLVHLNVYAFNEVEAVITPSDDARSAELVDAIFEAVLVAQRWQTDEWWHSWPECVGFIDYRVHLDDYFAKATDFSNAGSMFFAPDNRRR